MASKLARRPVSLEGATNDRTGAMAVQGWHARVRSANLGNSRADGWTPVPVAQHYDGPAVITRRPHADMPDVKPRKAKVHAPSVNAPRTRPDGYTLPDTDNGAVTVTYVRHERRGGVSRKSERMTGTGLPGALRRFPSTDWREIANDGMTVTLQSLASARNTVELSVAPRAAKGCM